MKINEIIVESRSQLDEGMMDTIKSKLSGVYQMARKKYPNFDEVFAVAKSHKTEINDIIEQLKAKKETGKLSKEDVVAAVMPLSKKIAGEVGGKGVVNEGFWGNMEIVAGGVGGFLLSPVLTVILAVLGADMSLGDGAILGTAIGIVAGIISGNHYDSNENDKKLKAQQEQERWDKLSPEQKRRENVESERKNLQSEYDSLELHYKNQHRSDYGRMSYAQTRRMEELYNQGFR